MLVLVVHSVTQVTSSVCRPPPPRHRSCYHFVACLCSTSAVAMRHQVTCRHDSHSSYPWYPLIST